MPQATVSLAGVWSWLAEQQKKLMMAYTVCIVEDDADIRFMLRRNLEKEGYRVEEYEDAYPLFDKESGWPDLFLLDIELPGINGLEICGWLKAQAATSGIPVLFLSGSPELKVLASNTLADGYLAKPFQVPALLELVRSKLPEQNSQLSLAGIPFTALALVLQTLVPASM